jgi:proteasome accessory factor B
MDRTERLLDLVALFLDAREPLSWSDLRQAFPHEYGGSSEAAERKFERDKAELLELGIPITYRKGGDEEKDGYLVEREAYYLPDPGLSPEELAVLYAAGSAALAAESFPRRGDLAHALRKIGFCAGAKLPAPRVRLELEAAESSPELAQHLERLWAAAESRKLVELSYFSPHRGELTLRQVAPYGLALRRGVWSLVGHCRLRDGIRTFLVHRIRSLEVNPARPRSPDFEVPEGFRLEEHVASYPWQHAIHEPLEVELELRGELAPLAPSLFPHTQPRPGPEGVRVTVRASDLGGLLRYALSLGSGCRVIGPERARGQLRQMASRILALHAP